MRGQLLSPANAWQNKEGTSDSKNTTRIGFFIIPQNVIMVMPLAI